MDIFLILAALIYNEFLVINIWGLGKNTKLFLEYEAKDENSLDKDSDNFSDLVIDFREENNPSDSDEIE